MKPENKITIPEVHARLNELAGREISARDLSTLLHCWRRHMHYKNRGRQGWLSQRDADSFLRYAW